MPTWQIEWTAQGTATVEADDCAEAEQIMSDALFDHDTVMLETYDVEDVSITTCDQDGDDA